MIFETTASKEQFFLAVVGVFIFMFNIPYYCGWYTFYSTGSPKTIQCQLIIYDNVSFWLIWWHGKPQHILSPEVDYWQSPHNRSASSYSLPATKPSVEK